MRKDKKTYGLETSCLLTDEESAAVLREFAQTPWNERGIVQSRLIQIATKRPHLEKLFKKVFDNQATIEEVMQSKCLDCQILNEEEVLKCTMPDCPIWGYREKIFGKPVTIRMSEPINKPRKSKKDGIDKRKGK